MNKTKLIWLLVLAVGLCLFGTSCGGGSDPVTTPPVLNPDDQGAGGDPNEPITPGAGAGQFTLAGGFGDLRGVASSRNYVYVVDTANLYGFDKLGNLIANPIALPNTGQQVGVFPPRPDVDALMDTGQQIWNFPAVLHNPVSQYGCITIYGPNLDVATTVEDSGAPDITKSFALPGGQFDPPNPDAPFLIVRVYDMEIDRFGSILFTADIDIKATDPFPDYEHALVILNRMNGFTAETGSTATVEDADGNLVPIGVPCFDDSMGFAIGNLGSLTIDTYFPLNRTELGYTYYTGDLDFLKDFVGVTDIRLDPVTLRYTVGNAAANPLGFVRVIGDKVGNDPGSFSLNPPLDNDGALEDPDLTAGGPSGMTVNHFNDNVYICDPGNRRIQVFNPTTGAFIEQLGTGLRGVAGNSFLAPSELWIDDEGLTFVCDVNQFRVLRDKLPDREYGHVGGTVRRIDNGMALSDALVTLGNDLGTVAARVTNINGDYLINNIVIGTYYMTAGKFNYDSDTAEVQIITDTVVRADFKLAPRTPVTTGSYSGQVTDDFSNVYLPDVLVEIVGTSIKTTTDSLGNFELANLQPGTWQVRFSHDGYVTTTKDVQIVGGSVYSDHIEMIRE